ncbi:MAG TPA: biopolymer transporter ExbD [Flavobacteriales bacterium]|nr:biopolymer transporter ExbD [Flavobacteriales bacterium]
MKIKRKKRAGAEVPTHSLNDIMFFLLLFFLIISALGNPDTRPVENPESVSTVQISEKMPNLTITENKEYYLDNNPIKEEELDEQMKKVSEAKEDAGMSLSMDRKLKVSDIVTVINIAKKYKLKLFLKTSKKMG